MMCSPLTRAAVEEAMLRSGIDGDPTVDGNSWQNWLRDVSQVAFTATASTSTNRAERPHHLHRRARRSGGLLRATADPFPDSR